MIVGGSDAGIQAGLRAREVAPDADVTVLVADEYPNFSICGLPYWLGGEVSDWHDLAHRTLADLQAGGLRVLLNNVALAIDADTKSVMARNAGGATDDLPYDRLIVATGADPVMPPLPGATLPGVHLLHHMADAFELDRALRNQRVESALIVGAGYIGLETAEALRHRGLTVTIVEQLPEVLPTVDEQLGELVHAELANQGVDVRTATTVQGIAADDSQLRVETDAHDAITVDVVLISVGVRPNTALAAEAGARLGMRGSIQVDEAMRTSLPDVWAAGDCVHTHHRLLSEPGYLPLGTTAHKQGRVAGENAVGGHRTFAGSLGTQVVKVFDLAIARTGLRHHEAHDAGFDPLTTSSSAPDHKTYYPTAHDLHMRWTADVDTRRLLGCQIVGHRDAQVAKRIDTVATVIYADLTVDQISDLDLAYSPPFASPWDALQTGAQHIDTALERLRAALDPAQTPRSTVARPYLTSLGTPSSLCHPPGYPDRIDAQHQPIHKGRLTVLSGGRASDWPRGYPRPPCSSALATSAGPMKVPGHPWAARICSGPRAARSSSVSPSAAATRRRSVASR